jgi:lysozyme family protein
MADFQTALTGLLAREGGWNHHPHDQGGETYAGISRHHHPDWPGWRFIDASREHPAFPDLLTDLTCLKQQVTNWYRTYYWDRIGGGRIASQRVANRLLDLAVHLGPARAASILQQTLNLLCSLGRPQLAIDSIIGPRTQTAIDHIHNSGRSRTLTITLSIRQGEHYLARVRETPTQRVFLDGWLSRLDPA